MKTLEDIQREIVWSLKAYRGQTAFLLIRTSPEKQQEISAFLQSIKELKVQVVKLAPTDTRLLATLSKKLEDSPRQVANPSKYQAILIEGLDLVAELDNMFVAANMVRDSFKKFCCPILFLCNTETYCKIVRLAPDWESCIISLEVEN